MTRALSLAACLAFALSAASAHAADPGPDALIEQGLASRRNGKPEEALDLFRQAHALAPSSRTFGQMGLVETSLKRWVDGETHLSISLTSPDDPWVRKNRTFLDEALGICKQHVGELVVSGPAGVEVFVGGKSVGTLPTVPAIRLAEGSATVTASASGLEPFTETTMIFPGGRAKVTITMAAVAPAPTPAPLPLVAAVHNPPPSIVVPTVPARASTAGSWHTGVGIAVAGAGTAALAWGIVWIAINGDSAAGGVYDTRTPGWVLAGAGAAALAGGAAIFFTGPSTTSTVAVGIAPGSFLLRARF